MKRTAKNSVNTAETRAHRAQSGSTIVAVLVAITFISVATSFMVKNTGSHAASSRSYAAVKNSWMTVNSGLVATEAFFPSDTGQALRILNDFLDTTVNNGQPEYIYGVRNGNKREIAAGSGQFFSSRLTSFNPWTRMATFDIRGGRRADRSLQAVQAFYRVENVGLPPPPPAFGGRDAFFFGGEGIFNAPLTVRGSATFASPGAITVNSNTNGMNFLSSCDCCACLVHRGINLTGCISTCTAHEDDVFFNPRVNFNPVVTSEVRTFFNRTVELQSGSRFLRDVGFVDSVYRKGTQGIHFGGNVWVGGTFSTLGGGMNITATPDNTLGTFNYTNRLLTSIANPITNNTNIVGFTGRRIEHTDRTNPSAPVPLLNETTILQSMQIQTLAGRMAQEPRLNNPITVMRDANPAFQPLRTSALPWNSTPAWSNGVRFDVNNVSAAMINAIYNNPDYAQHKNAAGYLIIHVNSTIGFNSPEAQEFNGNVVFVVADDGSTRGGNMQANNGGFYRSSPTSNTLIYAARGGNMGTEFGGRGYFRGLVYIDDSFDGNQFNLNWRPGTIDGAVLIRGTPQRINWNTNNHVTVRRDNAVLGDFGVFVEGGSVVASGNRVVNTPPGEPITLTTLGIFYR